MIRLQGMAEHRFSNVYLVFDKKKKRKSAIKQSSLQFYGINFGKNQAPLQRNGIAAIPKSVNLSFCFSV